MLKCFWLEKRVPVGGAFLPNACSLAPPKKAQLRAPLSPLQTAWSRLFVERVELLIELFWEVRENMLLACNYSHIMLSIIDSSLVARPTPTLVLQVTNVGMRRPGYKAKVSTPVVNEISSYGNLGNTGMDISADTDSSQK